jgi:glycosyltransferase involved in cell wall biosynthesis
MPRPEDKLITAIGDFLIAQARMKLTIITPVLNAGKTIVSSLESLKQQYYPFEHVIVDGNSGDDTLEKIIAAKTENTKIISEPDLGLYHALNKGIRQSGGDVIGILNGDDRYAAPNIFRTVAAVFKQSGAESCYGDLVYVDRKNESKVIRYWKSSPFKVKRFYQGWMPPHPTFFVRRRIYQKYGLFNLNLGSSADYELMLRFLFKYRISTAYIPKIMINMRSGGLSNASLKNRLIANRNDRRAWTLNGLEPRCWTLYLKPLSKLGQFVARWKPPSK